MPVRMVVLGDSVPWGQGLLPEQKLHDQVRRHLGIAAEDCLMLAHSGATIDATFDSPDLPVPGEVPKFYPTVTEQCQAAAAAAATAEVVLVNGGINDVDIGFILNPFTDRRSLVNKTHKYCHVALAKLLRQVLVTFPGATIVVTGYYPVLSDLSHAPHFPDFLLTMGAPVAPALRLLELRFDAASAFRLLFAKVVANCRIFAEESTLSIQEAVAEADGGAGRIGFARVPFAPENSALAPSAWLFGVTAALAPEDPVAAERHLACNLFERDPFQREQCYRASAGHPNQAGARQFAAAIVSLL